MRLQTTTATTNLIILLPNVTWQFSSPYARIMGCWLLSSVINSQEFYFNSIYFIFSLGTGANEPNLEKFYFSFKRLWVAGRSFVLLRQRPWPHRSQLIWLKFMLVFLEAPHYLHCTIKLRLTGPILVFLPRFHCFNTWCCRNWTLNS